MSKKYLEQDLIDIFIKNAKLSGYSIVSLQRDINQVGNKGTVITLGKPGEVETSKITLEEYSLSVEGPLVQNEDAIKGAYWERISQDDERFAKLHTAVQEKIGKYPEKYRAQIEAVALNQDGVVCFRDLVKIMGEDFFIDQAEAKSLNIYEPVNIYNTPNRELVVGGVYYADLNVGLKAEFSKVRPVVVLKSSAEGTALIAPITSNYDPENPQIKNLIPNLGLVNYDNLRTISTSRIFKQNPAIPKLDKQQFDELMGSIKQNFQDMQDSYVDDSPASKPEKAQEVKQTLEEVAKDTRPRVFDIPEEFILTKDEAIDIAKNVIQMFNKNSRMPIRINGKDITFGKFDRREMSCIPQGDEEFSFPYCVEFNTKSTNKREYKTCRVAIYESNVVMYDRVDTDSRHHIDDKSNLQATKFLIDKMQEKYGDAYIQRYCFDRFTLNQKNLNDSRRSRTAVGESFVRELELVGCQVPGDGTPLDNALDWLENKHSLYLDDLIEIDEDEIEQ